MIKKILFACFVCGLCIPTHTLAAITDAHVCSQSNSQTMCRAGCEWNDTTNTCFQCRQNYYCPNGQSSTQCPAQFPKSEPGSQSQTDCYYTCENKQIASGHIKPDEEKVYWLSGKSCSYTKPENVVCAEGLGVNPGLGTSIQDTQPATTPVCAKTIQCKDSLELKDCHTSNDQIDGEATWDADNKHWDYTNCLCTKSGANIGNGTGKKQCGYGWSNGQYTIWDKNCITIEILTCDAGYCEQKAPDNDPICALTPAGYYSADSTKTCAPCPMGSTSNEGTARIEDCYIKGGSDGTQFCDAQGENCFTLDTEYKATMFW